jgi:hypothetical protein
MAVHAQSQVKGKNLAAPADLPASRKKPSGRRFEESPSEVKGGAFDVRRQTP